MAEMMSKITYPHVITDILILSHNDSLCHICNFDSSLQCKAEEAPREKKMWGPPLNQTFFNSSFLSQIMEYPYFIMTVTRQSQLGNIECSSDIRVSFGFFQYNCNSQGDHL